jgi:hypothetical protein
MLMRIELPAEIQVENNHIKADHEERIKEWNWKPKDSRTTKPRMKKTVCQTLACYCGIQNCMMRTNGEGCVTCKSFCDQGLRKQLLPVVDSHGAGANNMKCPCATCQCPCLEANSSHTYATILLNFEAKKEELNLKKSLQSMLDDGKLIASQLNNARVSLIQKDGLEKYSGLEPEKSQEAFEQDALAYASFALASDPTLNSNVGHRKRLQEAIGERSTREVRSTFILHVSCSSVVSIRK